MRKQIFKALANAQPLSDADLVISSLDELRSMPVFNFINETNRERRTILVAELVGSLDESSINNYGDQAFKIERHNLDVKPGSRIRLSNAGFEFEDDWCEGEIELNVINFTITPLIGEAIGLDDSRKRAVDFSNLLVIYLIFSKKRGTELKPKTKGFIYESYNRLGFVVADKYAFNDFIVAKLGAGVHNLVDAFTTTELAEELFKGGLMILCWGITPWAYMIASCSTNDKSMYFPSFAHPDCRGEYFFCGDMENVCIIPGVDLLSWRTDDLKQWPTFNVEGSGNVVQLDLFVLRAAVVKTDKFVDFIPIPYFSLQRRPGEIAETRPILSFDIERL